MMTSRKVCPDRGIPGALTVLLAFFAFLCCLAAGPAAAGASAWALLQEAIEQAEDGDIVTMTEDVIAAPEDTRLTIPPGKWIALDLNGHTLDRHLNGHKVYDGCVLFVPAGAILTLRDSGGGEGKVTGGYHDKGGGILNRGTLIMEGGCVTGNIAQYDGGGLANEGIMILLGGQVTGNTALGTGGGVWNQAKARLTVRGGLVSGNSAPENSDITNEGALTITGPGADQTRLEDMPLIHRFMAELTVFPTAALLLALLLAVWAGTHLGRERKTMMLVIAASVLVLILQNLMDYDLSLKPGASAFRLPFAVLGYALRPAILAMFLSIVRPGRRYRAAWALVGVNGCVYLTAFFSGIAFSFNENGRFIEGPLHQTCTVVSAVLFVWLFILTMRQFHPRLRRESWIPIFVTVLIAGAVVMDFVGTFDEQPISFLTMSIAVSCVFYYIWLHLQFVREHEKAMQAEQRIRIMMTQIKPHFLYNALGAIEDLCSSDPKKARETTAKFSQYLRGNMDSISQTAPIPFEKELAHTKLYLDMEQVRFREDLQVRFEIDCTDFSIPALTLEPIVENAVRHGVRGNPDGRGTVTIRSRDAGDHYAVTVTDDGPGFDPGQPRDGKTHIGISNVRDRLEKMCAGEMHIQSEPGRGTTVTILIPKEDAPC